MKKPGGNGDRRARCVCTWKTPMCCEMWKEAYKKAAQQTMKDRLKQKEKEKAAAEKIKDMMPPAVRDVHLVKKGR